MKTIASILLILITNTVFANMPQYEIDIKQIVQEFVKDMEKNPNIKCIGRGGSMPHDIEAVELTFYVYKKGSIEEGRHLEIFATEKLKNMINSSDQIKPYLHEYPFPSKRVKISFSFRQSNNDYYNDGSIVFVLHAKDALTYYIYDKKIENQIEVFEESYQDALKIVSEETS